MPRRVDDDEDDNDFDDDFDVRLRSDRRSDAEGRLAGPAIALIVCRFISILVRLIYLPIAVYRAAIMPGPEIDEARRLGQLLGAGCCVPIMILCDVFVAFGAFQMKSASNYGLAVTAAIIAVIPCFSSCYMIGIPFGIWALIFLNDQEVKAAFYSRR